MQLFAKTAQTFNENDTHQPDKGTINKLVIDVDEDPIFVSKTKIELCAGDVNAIKELVAIVTPSSATLRRTVN